MSNFAESLDELLEAGDTLRASILLICKAPAIRDLVVAAENVSKILDHPTLSVSIPDASKLREALAKLEEQ